jgi:hypothetical protein
MSEVQNDIDSIYPPELQKAFALAGVITNPPIYESEIAQIVGDNIGHALKEKKVTIDEVYTLLKENPLLNREIVWRHVAIILATTETQDTLNIERDIFAKSASDTIK